MQRELVKPRRGIILTAVVFLLTGCSITAYQQYLSTREAYDQCVRQNGRLHTQCVAEREKLDGALSAYEREAERNYWWRNAVEDEREKDPLYRFDHK